MTPRGAISSKLAAFNCFWLERPLFAIEWVILFGDDVVIRAQKLSLKKRWRKICGSQLLNEFSDNLKEPERIEYFHIFKNIDLSGSFSKLHCIRYPLRLYDLKTFFVMNWSNTYTFFHTWVLYMLFIHNDVNYKFIQSIHLCFMLCISNIFLPLFVFLVHVIYNVICCQRLALNPI